MWTHLEAGEKFNMKKLGDDVVAMARMIMLRGLGYKQAEIAEELGVVPGTISYQLRRLRKLAEKHGAVNVFGYYIKGLKLSED